MTTITAVHLERDRTNARVLAEGYVVLNHDWQLNGVRVIRGDAGRLLVSLPHKWHGERFNDFLHPRNKSARRYLDDTVLAAYAKLVDEDEAS